MQICDSWLRDWVDHGLAPAELADRLTMLGVEVESVTAIGAPVERLVVGRVLDVRRHPDADKLSLCRVDVGRGEPLPIVCGARNVHAGGLYPTALEGARLPGGMTIGATHIRGELSAGMLCSAAELGLEAAEGLLELDPSAVPGSDASRLLALGDSVLELNITPNRPDCFSVSGIAREVAAPAPIAVREPDIPGVSATIRDTLPVTIADAGDCPRFAGRVLRGLDAGAATPLWMRERLRRCGIRPIHAVVDVTNYVMLELGQPMHAYDLASLQGGIAVRRGRPGESLVLLDGQQAGITADVLVISDDRGAIGLAGIMGGSATAVTATTADIFLESAWFAPTALAGRARRFGMHTDASVRFERGVDPTLQARAIERATALILEIAGGQSGPVTDIVTPERLPVRRAVGLRRVRLAHVLGATVPDAEVARIFGRLQMGVAAHDDGWAVTPGPARFDIEHEEDLIEEVARVHGYGKIPEVAERAALHPASVGESVDPMDTARTLLVARGYHEALTYSFIEPRLGVMLGAADFPQLALSNPISTDMAAMRQSLWPGLLRIARTNLHRQENRIRFFEMGTRFVGTPGGGHREEMSIAGVAIGNRLPEQWGAPAAAIDVFDVKADVEALLKAGGQPGRWKFEEAAHPALHPGRAAQILDGSAPVGWIGELHPAVARDLELPAVTVVLFELQARAATDVAKPVYRPVSKFPSIRRDVAVVVAREVSTAALLDVVRRAAPIILREAFVFDIYSGPQVGPTEKSVAMGLILQDTSRTLTDDDADGILKAVRAALAREFQARIRE